MRYLALALLALPATALATPTLSISGECPGDMTLDITGLAPGGNMTLLFSRGLGADPVPAGGCMGTETGLSPVRWGITVPDNDADGAITFMPNVPDSACGMNIQILDPSDCSLSAVVALEGGGGAFEHDNGLGVIWYNDVPTGTIDESQAQLSCEASYGTCYLSTGDCAGWGYCQSPDDGQCWGWEDGCSGSAGRVWEYGSSFTTYGYWN